MDENIQVSVLCSAYNHEKYIRDALEGFVRQKTNFRYEVLVHDDASTDRTADIIREYERKYPDIIKPYYEEENQYSKNNGMITKIQLGRAKGKYIASCEGDDFWNSPDKLQKQFDALEAHPECSICVCTVRCCNEDGTPNERIIPDSEMQLYETQILSQDTMAEMLFQKFVYPFHTSSYFYRRSVRDQFDPHMWESIDRDREILKSCLAAGSFYYIAEPLSTRRLESIGNWNSRMKKDPFSFKKLIYVDTIRDLKYCSFLGGKYMDIVQPLAYSRLLIGSYVSPKKTVEIIKMYGLGPSLTGCGILKRIRKKIVFHLFMIFPKAVAEMIRFKLKIDIAKKDKTER